MKTKHKLLFWFIIILLAFAYNYHNILKKDAYSIHQWRQADCLSLTMSYYEKNASFFNPSIYWIGEKKDSHVMSEFPIIYYLIGNLWKITGKNVMFFRLFNTLIVLLGLYFLFKAVHLYLNNLFWSFFIPIFLFTSPVLVYYSNNFLMDAPAFGIILIAWYFYFKFKMSDKKINLYIAILLFTLGGLLKISSLLSFVALVIIEVLSMFNFSFLKEIPKNKNKLILLGSFAFVFAIIFIWYTFSKDYNSKHLQGIFLQGILPIWEQNFENIINNFRSLFTSLYPSFFSISPLIFIFFIFLFLVLEYKRSNKFLFSITSLIFIGTLIYIILFFGAFTVHDYYLTNLLIFIPFTLLTFFEFLKNNHENIFYNKNFKILASILLFFLIYYTSAVNRLKYNSKDGIAKYCVFINPNELNLWKWYHWDYKNHFKALESISSYLDSIGVKKTDTVISLPDQSINISLYFMQRSGFTNFGYNHLKTYEEKIQRFKELGADYLIINDTTLLKDEGIRKFTQYKIGQYKNVMIFKL